MQPHRNRRAQYCAMRVGPFGTAELGIMLLAALPWLVALALVTAGLHYLRRAARAQERIADALERERRAS